MAQLRTDYKDEILDVSVNTQRKYRQVDNGDGTISFVDVTEYSQQGDPFGAGDINAITSNLTADNGESFNFAYNSETNEYGYMAKVEGADTFFPFKSGIEFVDFVNNNSKGVGSASCSVSYTVEKSGKYFIFCTSSIMDAGASDMANDGTQTIMVNGVGVANGLENLVRINNDHSIAGMQSTATLTATIDAKVGDVITLTREGSTYQTYTLYVACLMSVYKV